MQASGSLTSVMSEHKSDRLYNCKVTVIYARSLLPCLLLEQQSTELQYNAW